MDHKVLDNLLIYYMFTRKSAKIGQNHGQNRRFSRKKYGIYLIFVDIIEKTNLNRILTFDFSKTAKRLIQTGYRRLCEG